MAETPGPGPRLLGLYAGAGLAGALLALAGLIADRDPRAIAGRGLVALVNDAPISVAQYDATLRALATDKLNSLSDDDRRHALDVLIDEELLFQAGQEAGLVRADADLRKRVVNAALRQATAPAANEAVSLDRLRAHFAANLDYFTPAAQVRAEVLVISGVAPERRAALARATLAAWAAQGPVDAAPDATWTRPLPDALIPVGKLGNYLGPALSTPIATGRPGDLIGPIDALGGLAIARILDRVAAAPPAFDAVAPLVEADYRRRRADALAADYVAHLRRRARILDTTR